ncbi:hypothetical protein LZ189_26300, partial [Rhodovulum sulfidophilum]|nr:hypothetical protein [Rhodovulum sulfidophilum]
LILLDGVIDLDVGRSTALLRNRRNQWLQRLVRRVSCSPSSAMSCLESHSATQDPLIVKQSRDLHKTAFGKFLSNKRLSRIIVCE